MNGFEPASLEQLKGIYLKYSEDYAKAVAKAPLCAGLLGLGESPKNAPCHEIFYESVGQWTEAFLRSDPTAEEAGEALKWILEAADRCRDSGTYPYCFAAQGHAEKLIALAPAQVSLALCQWYDRAYPPIERMPVQKKIYKLLKKHAKHSQR